MSKPAIDQETAEADATGYQPRRVARGARHVQLGLALNVAGTIALAAIVSAGTHDALSATDWIGTIVFEVILVAAVLSSSRLARGFVLLTGTWFAVAAAAVAAFALSLPGTTFDMGVPELLVAGAMAVVGAGSFLATITPAARAWHRARLAARATRKRVRSLADWRAAG